MRLGDISVRKKLLTAFFLMSLVVGYVGWSGHHGIIDIIKSSSLIDADTEMQVAVRGEGQIIMELIAARQINRLEEIWKQHLQLIKHFEIFSDAVLSGRRTTSGITYATNDKSIKDIVRHAREIYMNQYILNIEKIYTLKKNSIPSGLNNNKLQESLRELDQKTDSTEKRLLELIGGVGDRAKKKMASTVRSVMFQALAGTAFAATMAIGMGLFLSAKIAGPLGQAVAFAQMVTSGNLVERLDIRQKDEIGILAD